MIFRTLTEVEDGASLFHHDYIMLAFNPSTYISTEINSTRLTMGHHYSIMIMPSTYISTEINYTI